MKHDKRLDSAGFTLMELMIVLAIIAMLAVFALPKLTKNIGKTKITDAVSMGGAIANQVEAICAAKETVPNISDISSDHPQGYGNATLSGTCADFKVKFVPSTSNSLPTICIFKEASGSIRYNWTLGGGFTDTDVPIQTGPNGKRGNTAC